MNTPIRVSVATLLLATPLGMVVAEPADSWSANLSNAPTVTRNRQPERVAAPIRTPVATPAPVRPATVVARPAPAAPPATVVARPAVAPARSPVAPIRSNYTPPNAVSSAPTVNVDNQPVPQATQRELDEDLWLAALAGNLGLVRDLLDQGANPRITTRYGETAVHAAAARGHTQVIMYLRERGVNLHARTSNGWTALHHAARFGQTAAANYLVKAGLNPNLPTNDDGRKTPLDIALDKNDLRMARILGY